MPDPSPLVVVGSGSPLGSRVVELARAAEPSTEIIPISSGPPGALPSQATLVWAAPAPVAVGAPDGLGAGGADAGDPFEVAEAAGIERLVLISGALVYGAHPANSVPLAEDSPLRGDLGAAYVSQRAEMERRAVEWRAAGPQRRVAVLRPAVTVSADSAGWFRHSVWSRAPLGSEDCAWQFLHLDDLARAVLVAASEELNGAYNVAPDGWIDAEGLRALAGPAGWMRLPGPVARIVAGLRSRVMADGAEADRLATGVGQYPLVLANDRLRAAGWAPRVTNEEAYVTADPGGPLAAMSARRRQEAAMVGVGVLVAVPLLGLVGTWLSRRLRGRRTPRPASC